MHIDVLLHRNSKSRNIAALFISICTQIGTIGSANIFTKKVLFSLVKHWWLFADSGFLIVDIILLLLIANKKRLGDSKKLHGINKIMKIINKKVLVANKS